MNGKVIFSENYEHLFNEAIHKYVLTPSLKKQKQNAIQINPQNSLPFNSQAISLRQTNYFAFGQSVPVRSTSIKNTFINLGNNRYQINLTPEPQLNKPETFYLKNMDFFKSTHQVNNLTFPIINQKHKQPKKNSSIFPLNQNPAKVMNRSKTFSKKKKNQMRKSLELNVQTKSFLSKSLQKKSSIDSFETEIISPQIQSKKLPLKSIGSLSKSVDVQATNFLRQMIFAKEYEKKLFELEKNFALKRKLKQFNKNQQKKLDAQKQSLDPWNHQHPNLNSPQDNQIIFDNANQRPINI